MQTETIARLQYISQGLTFNEQKNHILRALDAGAPWIQLRWKLADEKELFILAELVKKACDQFNAKCIINDHVQLAKELEADGVHLGLEDCSIAKARQLLGPQKIIGGTANSFADVLQRIDENCDYIGLGPFKHSNTKQKLSPLLGIEGYKNIVAQLSQLGSQSIPLFAIGGIASLEDIKNLLDTGIYGVALSGFATQTPHTISSIKTYLSCTNYK
jgi:thiamine-phosphate pyrophosphorylase